MPAARQAFAVAPLAPPPALRALSFFARRLRLRAAVFLWMVPLAAILSSRRVTLRSSASAFFTLPPVHAVVKVLIASFKTSLRARLRARRRAFWRTRFFAEMLWATVILLLDSS